MVKPRVLAWKILRSGGETPLRRARRALDRVDIDARDRALVRALISAEVRRRGTLTTIVREFLPRSKTPELAAHLHLGLVQLLFLDHIPDHAAVGETVRAAQATLGDRAGRIVNAVLREVLRCRVEGASGDARRDLVDARWHFSRPIFHDPKEHPLLWAEEALSMPAAWMRRWINRLGAERSFELARSALKQPALSIRVARGSHAGASDAATKGETRPIDALTCAEVAAELTALGCTPSPARHADVLLVPPAQTARVVESELFARGAITVQGETALRAAELLDVHAGERVLDLCAAPGGKTAVLAQSGARVLACDSSAARMERLCETIARLRLEGAVECAVLSDGGPEGRPPFDGVLVDVPCSNTGVFAQRPEARWRFESKFRESLARAQAELLERAASNVRAGGRLVYSTCSIEPEENQRRVRAFLVAHPDFRIEAEIEALPGEAHELGPIDGGYAARLRRD